MALGIFRFTWHLRCVQITRVGSCKGLGLGTVSVTRYSISYILTCSLLLDGLRSRALIAHVGPVLVEPVLENVCRWCGHNLFGKTVPLWYHSLAEEEFSDV